jgi:hypothetical protein
MSTDRDVERIVRLWLDEGVTQLPDRVLDLALDQLPATPQRRPSWLARRNPSMNNYARFGLVAAAVVLAAVVGIGLYARSGVGGPPPEASASSAPSLVPSPTASPINGPIVGTWATGETTCEQQLAAIQAAGYTADQMTSVGVDLTCANGIAVQGAGWANGTQFTMGFFPDGRLVVSDDVYGDSTLTYRLIGDTTFEANDAKAQQICLTYGYAIAGDQLTIEIIDNGCPATRAGQADAPLLDQIGLTVLFETSSFTRQP